MKSKLNYENFASRIKNEIARFQYNSELIIIGIESALITLLFIRYFNIRHYTSESTQHLLTDPILISIFAGLILTRLGFLYAHKLSRFILGVFVVTEMSLVIYAAKAHEIELNMTQEVIANTNVRFINYVLLLILLRTLRFDPLMVFLAGITAAIGWSILALSPLHAININIGNLSVNNPILFTYLVHEAGRIIIILFTTSVLTLAIYRARNVLWHAASDRQAIKDLMNFFDSDVAEKITQSKFSLQPGQGERRFAAIMFIDLRGFTKTTETLSPTDVIYLLSEYQTLVVPIIQKNNGTIDKFLGDGILASFGALKDSKTYAVDALRTVDEIIKAIELWRQQRKAKQQMIIDIGLGVAVGHVVFGVIGDSGRLEYTVIGNAVNLASKLEKQNKIEHSHAVITHETLMLAIGQGYENHQWPTARKTTKIEDIDTPVDLVVLP